MPIIYTFSADRSRLALKLAFFHWPHLENAWVFYICCILGLLFLKWVSTFPHRLPHRRIHSPHSPLLEQLWGNYVWDHSFDAVGEKRKGGGATVSHLSIRSVIPPINHHYRVCNIGWPLLPSLSLFSQISHQSHLFFPIPTPYGITCEGREGDVSLKWSAWKKSVPFLYMGTFSRFIFFFYDVFQFLLVLGSNWRSGFVVDIEWAEWKERNEIGTSGISNGNDCVECIIRERWIDCIRRFNWNCLILEYT